MKPAQPAAPDATAAPTEAPPADAAWDPSRKWVRIVQTHDSGLVEFEFAVGEPQLYVEMAMHRPQFDDFCALHGVVPTTGGLPAAPLESDAHEWDWNLHAAREQRFRHEP